jgi:hypothetical protein
MGLVKTTRYDLGNIDDKRSETEAETAAGVVKPTRRGERIRQLNIAGGGQKHGIQSALKDEADRLNNIIKQGGKI